MKVAVTGASGHIGSCLVRKLIKKGAKVKILVHSFRNEIDQLDVEIITGDLLDQKTVTGLCEKADVVFHLAALISIDRKDKYLVYKTNVEGTRNIIKTCFEQKVKKLIQI